MRELSDNDLMSVSGGSISGTVLQYTVKLFTTVFDLGRTLGTSIRRLYEDALCPVQKVE